MQVHDPMLALLPNMRTGLLIGSGFFVLFSLASVLFNTFSKRVQSGHFWFGEGQWISTVVMFICGGLFVFGFSLPEPQGPKVPLAQLRNLKFEEYYASCIKKLYTSYPDISSQRDCTDFAREQADSSFGITPPKTKVVNVPAPAPQTKVVTRTVWVNQYVGQQERAEKFTDFYNACFKTIEQTRKMGEEEMRQCTRLANFQTDASILGPHRQIITKSAGQ